MRADRNSEKSYGLVPPVPRGEDRRSEIRDSNDWRVNPRSYEFCGAVFDPLDPLQTLARCKWVTAEHGFRYIVTPNVDHLVRLNKEPDLYGPLYKGSWLSVCDSRILELLAKFTGIPLKAVPGSDLTAQLFDNVIKKDEPINVIGGDEDVITKVKERYGLTALNHCQPPMGLRHNPDEVVKCAEFIANNPARYTFICVGSPQQEMVAMAAKQRGDCAGLGLCVGASLDFLAGKVKRAPKWMQFMRTEWLYRLLSEPRRLWKRYLVDGPRIFAIWAKWIFKRK
ncbi:MAG: glycosyltransferase [Acidimicrobiales bacterium]|nr:WecB/TagA/CpsF family glycosyltransferase [Hyphomonadaceae bacterium]RZV44975.1 MAG: glycosyltransferase [Acidimicrobiales bacterium]